ncbi:MAG: hypothetical protein V1659_00915 [Candidatus Woesearchaeota archaeon]
MKKTKKVRKTVSPRLSTVVMVEDTLKKMDQTEITIAGLKKILPKQVNHNTLKEILDYLDKSNKIAVSIHGIVWIHNPDTKLQKAIRTGMRI